MQQWRVDVHVIDPHWFKIQLLKFRNPLNYQLRTRQFIPKLHNQFIQSRLAQTWATARYDRGINESVTIVFLQQEKPTVIKPHQEYS